MKAEPGTTGRVILPTNPICEAFGTSDPIFGVVKGNEGAKAVTEQEDGTEQEEHKPIDWLRINREFS